MCPKKNFYKRHTRTNIEKQSIQSIHVDLWKKERILHFDFVQPQKVNAFQILAMVCTAVYDINFYLWCCSSKLFSMEMKNFGKTWGKYLLEMETQNFFSYNEIP